MVFMVCDICGVGLGIWNNWKVMLLCMFYVLICEVFENGFEDINSENCEKEVKKVFCVVLLDWEIKDIW